MVNMTGVLILSSHKSGCSGERILVHDIARSTSFNAQVSLFSEQVT